MPDITELQSRCNPICFTKQESHGRYGFLESNHNEDIIDMEEPYAQECYYQLHPPLWKLLIDRGITETQFQEYVGLSTVAIAKLG
ncbi:helix-turn-helix domain-containing protein [Rothia sp. P13129]|uniref:helix-turn-helix domain-containing protein n=1 Tax=Rothia sp. P13129 TaxID=3402664 RepID=UPI003AD59B86